MLQLKIFKIVMLVQSTSTAQRELVTLLFSHAQTELYARRDLFTHNSVLQVTTALELELEKDSKLRSTSVQRVITVLLEPVSQFSAMLTKMKFVLLDLSTLNIPRSHQETVLQESTSDTVNVTHACLDLSVSSLLTKSIQSTLQLKEVTNALLVTIAQEVPLSLLLAQLEDSELLLRQNLKKNAISAQMDNSTLLRLPIIALLAEEDQPTMKTTLDVFARVISEPTWILHLSAHVSLVILNQISLSLTRLLLTQMIVFQFWILSATTDSIMRPLTTWLLVSVMMFVNLLISVSERDLPLDTTIMT
jgi:hypothetical protein